MDSQIQGGFAFEVTVLNPKSIYRKTEAGVTEVQARALGLRAELRRLLILIDGTATIARLSPFVRSAEIDLLVAALEFQGLITPLAPGQPPGIGAPSGKGRSSAPPPPVPATDNSAYDSLSEPTAAEVQAVRRAAVHMLHELLGSSAARLAFKIEVCNNAQQLRLAVTEVRLSLDQQLGAAAGQRFIDALRGAAERTR